MTISLVPAGSTQLSAAAERGAAAGARPEIPLHTNAAENDIRCHVTKRKVSGGTWSEPGRDARDACLGLIKTCQKLSVSFFDYLGHRLAVPNAPLVPPLANLIRACPTR